MAQIFLQSDFHWMPNTRLIYWGVDAISAIVEERNDPTESNISFADLLELSNMLLFILFRGIKRTECERSEGFYEMENIPVRTHANIVYNVDSTSRYSNSPPSIKNLMLPHSIELSTAIPMQLVAKWIGNPTFIGWCYCFLSKTHLNVSATKTGCSSMFTQHWWSTQTIQRAT